MSTAYDLVVDRIVDVTGFCGRRQRYGVVTRCPAHYDRSPSLSIKAAEDRVLLHCFAGCDIDDILASIELTRRDLFDRTDEPWKPTLREPRPPADPSWAYVSEPPDDPHGARLAAYYASTAHVTVGTHPGGRVPSWGN